VGLLKNSYERHCERQSLEAISAFASLFLTFLDCFVAIAPRKDNRRHFFNSPVVPNVPGSFNFDTHPNPFYFISIAGWAVYSKKFLFKYTKVFTINSAVKSAVTQTDIYYTSSIRQPIWVPIAPRCFAYRLPLRC